MEFIQTAALVVILLLLGIKILMDYSFSPPRSRDYYSKASCARHTKLQVLNSLAEAPERSTVWMAITIPSRDSVTRYGTIKTTIGHSNNAGRNNA